MSPRSGRVQYLIHRAGEVVDAGTRILTILDLNDVYMTIYLPAAQAGKLAIGDEARMILDPFPQYVVPATVSFVATEAQFTPKSVETAEEREKLIFRVKLQVDPKVLGKYHTEVKTGVRGLGFVRTDSNVPWPDDLVVKLPRVTDSVIAKVEHVSHRYGKTVALNDVTIEIPACRMIGMIGPDGVGKSTMLGLIAGVRIIQQGHVTVFDGDMADKAYRTAQIARIAYMPQGLGSNLYPTLSVFENIDFHGRLFGQAEAERQRRIDELLKATSLDPFVSRPAGKLSGGMKQKLSLCCALIHDPDLLILDEPTTGVDPLSRRQFWDLINTIRTRRPEMSVIVATAYMDEAERFDWLVAMNGGKVIATGTTAQILQKTGEKTLEAAFIALLPEEERAQHQKVVVRPRPPRRRRRAGHRGRGPNSSVRRFHSRGSRELSHRARRDFRLPRLERLRQVDHHENADWSSASHQRNSEVVRQTDGGERYGGAPQCRLHVAGLLALQRTDGSTESRTPRRALSFAGGRG